jgi:ReqiPepy6 Gp37-like protein
MAILVQHRDRTLAVRGELAVFTSLQLVLKELDISDFELRLPAADPRAAELDLDDLGAGQGGGILVWDDELSITQPMFTGRFRGVTRDSDDGGDLLTIRGQDDAWWLAKRLCYPNPAQPASNQTAAADVQTGPAEDLVKHYITANAGPGALASRQITGLTVAPSQGRGPTRTERVRFTPLLETVQTICRAANFGFRALQVGTEIQFDIVVPMDRSGEVILARERENLGSFSYAVDTAEANLAIVAGEGAGTARPFRERGSAIGDARAETFVDKSDTTVAAELDQAGDDALAEQAATVALSFQPLATRRSRYGVDFELGDQVTAIVDDVPLVEVVRQVTLAYEGGGVAPPEVLVGTPTQADVLRLLAQLPTLPALARRLGFKERTP